MLRMISIIAAWTSGKIETGCGNGILPAGAPGAMRRSGVALPVTPGTTDRTLLVAALLLRRTGSCHSTS
jgi:hypothetical protein